MNFNVPDFQNLWATYKDAVYNTIDIAEKEESIIIEAKIEVKKMLKEFEDVFDKETYARIFEEELNALITNKRKEILSKERKRYFNTIENLLDFMGE